MDILDYKEPITKIYFIRHGETKANVKRLLFGRLDLDLTKSGVRQARTAARNLSSVGAGLAPAQFDYIISSPLKRAKHTAKIIRRKLKIKKLIVDKNLIEKSEGLWEGKTFWEVRDKDSKNYKKWLRNPFRQRPPKGESTEDLNKRVKKFYKTILKKYLGKNIIVVTHSGPIRLFILNALSTNIDRFWHLDVDCGSISEVHLSKKHAMVVRINN